VSPVGLTESCRCETRGRGVMNAWNLSMDGMPMINRACGTRIAMVGTVGSFYSREKGRERVDTASEETPRFRSWKGMSFFDEALRIAMPRADKSSALSLSLSPPLVFTFLYPCALPTAYVIACARSTVRLRRDTSVGCNQSRMTRSAAK